MKYTKIRTQRGVYDHENAIKLWMVRWIWKYVKESVNSDGTINYTDIKSDSTQTTKEKNLGEFYFNKTSIEHDQMQVANVLNIGRMLLDKMEKMAYRLE